MSDKSFDQNILLKEDDAKFIDLARNAFDVMMRRGWSAQCVDKNFWYVCDDCGDDVVLEESSHHWEDPFTALVEADKWYREHGEATNTHTERG